MCSKHVGARVEVDRWDELGYALNTAGRREAARYSFARAVELGPTSNSTLLMSAAFQFQDHNDPLGFDLLSRALANGNDQVHDVAFETLEEGQLAADRVLQSRRSLAHVDVPVLRTENVELRT